MRCFFLGHRWGSWSKAAEYTVYRLAWGVPLAAPIDATLQFRTCDRCGLQQKRTAELTEQAKP